MQPPTNLSTICVVLFLICIEELGQTKVCDLYMLRSLHEDISRCQVTVYQVTLLQVVHTLLSNNNNANISISHSGEKKPCQRQLWI